MALSLQEILKQRLHTILDPSMGSGKRRGVLEGASKGGDDGEEYSITRYLRGAIWHNWQGAKKEQELFEEAQKAMSSDTMVTGGAIVHPKIHDQIIPLLRAKSVSSQLGMTEISLGETNALSMPKLSGGTTAYWVGENDEKTASELTFGEIDLKLKEVAGLVKIPNNLLEDSTPAADKIVREDLSTVLALAEDLALIQGVGGLQPLGLYNWPGVGSTTLTAAITCDNLLDAMETIESANGEYANWLMHPRSKKTLRKLKDATGKYIWDDGDISKALPPSLYGMPVHLSTQLPTNLTFGALTSCSYIILGSWKNYIKIQKRAGMKIDASTEAGTAFEYDQTWFRATRRVDCGPRHVEDFNIIKGVQ